MSAKNTCCAEVWSSTSYSSYKCGKAAKVEHEGKHYCGIHDPIKRKQKNEERKALFDAKYAAMNKKWRPESAAHDLLEALQEAKTRILELCACHNNPPPFATLARIDTAIRKALGEEE